MKKLNRKVFQTLFLILSFFIISGVIIYNISSYKKEYENIKRNLTFLEDRNINKPKNVLEPPNKEIEQMMIMDYEIYTVKLNNKQIKQIISHFSFSSNFKVKKIAKSIIEKKQTLKVGNLYWNKYAYNYNNDLIVIMNTENINHHLLMIIIKSILFLIIFEIIIFYISKILTKRITEPAKDAFDKQKNFIADASHELKTPLSVIMASSDELVIDKQNKKYIDNIKYESERMNNLIKSLLDLSKIENNGALYKEENLSKIVSRVCLTFDATIFEQDIKIKTNIKKDIMCVCCKEEIEKLIGIIMDNAIKHSYKKSTICVNVDNEKNNVIIEITNTGDPIKDGDEEKIFERFYRGDKSRNRADNRYGLGLAIAKSIVINHKGDIKAYSKDGNTTFKIILKK